jgi:hypothetical protein
MHTLTTSSSAKTGNKVESDIDLARLAEELSRLYEALEQQATQRDQKPAAGAIAAAEQMGGKWALDTASQIGVDVARAAITTALGIDLVALLEKTSRASRTDGPPSKRGSGR